ncbi:hypothetical protein [Mycolicibacterium sphagni]|uniref:hypothetical protein n=1 Tax=Mycolicibacterium sphagni TaxID=1786 RepID=UPI0021F2FEDE|nr:hypothetical protein [Mycolicibacterium sphagni]MCV7174849.1 hypothetical protein [Mycolicibacterium sphagni]
MSAYLVDPEHIHVLLHAAQSGHGIDGGLRWCVPDASEIYGYATRQIHVSAHPDELTVVGQMLLDQNAASVNHRYDEDNAYVYAYQRPRFAADWQPVDILKALDGYGYQACETPDWTTTEAHAFCEALRTKMIGRIAGYSDSPAWGISESTVPHHVAKRAALRAEQRAPEVVVAHDDELGQVLTLPRRTVTASAEYVPVDRDAAIKAIRAGLRRRSGKSWSVRGGRGTAWGWITIAAPPARSGKWGEMSDADAAELGELLGLGRSAHVQGVSVAADDKYRREYIARAEGREPDVIGTPYWD